MPRQARPDTVPTEAWWPLWLLLAVGIFNQLDRKVMAILQVPITQELHLSDSQLGALTGLSFALVYSLLSLPVSRIADRYSRKWLMIGALALWSLLTAASGFANGFVTLVICRMGVAFGESACTPASLSLISDYFARDRRALPIAIWSTAPAIGVMFGSAAGGWLASELGWRHAFIYIGLSGLVLIPFLLVLKEPARGRNDNLAAPVPKPPPLSEALKTLWGTRSMRYIILGTACLSYVFNTIVAWTAPFYSRLHDLPLAEIGIIVAVLFGAGGGLGSLLGGLLSNRLARDDPRGYTRVMMTASLLLTPAIIIQFLLPGVWASAATGFFACLLLNVYLAPANASLQSLARPNTRAFTSAITLVCAGLAGGGMGPLVTGMISDLLREGGLGLSAIRYAVCISSLVSCLGGAFYWMASRHIVGDFAGVHRPTSEALVATPATAVP